MRARADNSGLLALIAVTATMLACSSTSVVSPVADAGNEASAVDESPAPDSVTDAGVAPDPVTEKPSPVCHDLAQRGDPVVTVPYYSIAPPDEKPLGTITPGFYVVVSKIEYGATDPIEEPAYSTTAYVSPTRFYVLIEGTAGSERVRVAATFKWSIRDGMLERTSVCASDGTEGMKVSQRIDPSLDGFTIYLPGEQTALGAIAHRYVRADDKRPKPRGPKI